MTSLDRTRVLLSHEIILPRLLIKVLSVSAFIILTTLGAYIRIPLPFTPVPVTMQTFFVMLSVVFLGANLAGISQIGYIMFGYLGLPIFAGSSAGAAVLAGPTGGYLVGFVCCAYIIGRIIRLKKNFGWILFSFCLGSLIILVLGTIWLSVSMNIDFKKAFMLGFTPFIFGDLLKIIVVSYFYKNFKHKLKGFRK